MDIVSVLRLAIADRIGQDRFELWFGPSSRITLGPSVVQIEVGNRFTLDWLRQKLRREIEAVVRSQLSDDYAVEFRFNEQLAAKQALTKTPEQTVTDSRSAPPNSLASRRRIEPRDQSIEQRQLARLDTFVVGDCNRVGHTSAQVVLRQPGTVSPLFLHGPTGVGKTHLLEGLIQGLKQRPGRPRCVYLTAEQFTTYFLEGLHGKGLPSFRRRYRKVDLLVVDDIQFFSGKRATLEELLHTIDAVHREGGQLALAADRPPTDLNDMCPELINRITGGLVCALQSPAFETRLAILRHWSETQGIEIADEVLRQIAEHLREDVRQLRGALNRLYATSQAMDCPITPGMATDSLQDIFQASRRLVQLDDVERAICEVFSLQRQDLKSNRRLKSISQPRMLAMWLARKHTRAALSEIGEFFGRRSHSTVVSAQKSVDRWIKAGSTVPLLDRDQQVEDAIRSVEARLRAS